MCVCVCVCVTMAIEQPASYVANRNLITRRDAKRNISFCHTFSLFNMRQSVSTQPRTNSKHRTSSITIALQSGFFSLVVKSTALRVLSCSIYPVAFDDEFVMRNDCRATKTRRRTVSLRQFRRHARCTLMR